MKKEILSMDIKKLTWVDTMRSIKKKGTVFVSLLENYKKILRKI